MADEDVSLDEAEGGAGGGGKKKLIIIIVAAVLLLGGGGAAAYFLLFAGDDSAVATETATDAEEGGGEEASENSLAATYVAMPRPFVFNVMDGKRNRLVQIKVQLMVRGSANETLAQKHIPLLEGTLVRIFGSSSIGQLRSPEGKDQLRQHALDALNEATTKLEGKALINTVLFTGFVLQ